MDPIAHTLTGAALAASGLRRATPLATAALLIGANLPDIDAVTLLADPYLSLAHRRGWSHGILALALLPPLLAAALLCWDHLVRRRLRPAAPAARWWPLVLVSAIAVVSHPVLDWLNNYGMRWLMPFDGRWFYGDALFIIDPWLWLALGGVLFLTWSRRPLALVAWLPFWGLASWLMLTNALVPEPARPVWLVGIALLAALRVLRPAPGEPAVRLVLATVVLYMAANSLANIPARAQVRGELAALGLGTAGDIMIGPVPANPFRGTVVVATPEAYVLGRWDWFAEPRLTLHQPPIPRNLHHPLVAAAADDRQARRFLVWSRFPYGEVQATADGHQVRFRDARYASLRGGIAGPLVAVQGMGVAARAAPQGTAEIQME